MKLFLKRATRFFGTSRRPRPQTTNPWKRCLGSNRRSVGRSLLAFGIVLLSLTELMNVALAGNLLIPNASFESPATPFVDPRIDFWQKAPQPATFDTNIFGAWDNLAGVFGNAAATNADHIVNCDGNQLAYLFAYPQMALFQDFNSMDWSNASPIHAFSAKFEAGKSYRLTVGLTSSREEPLTPGSALQMSVYYRDASSNIVTVASTNVVYDTNVFANITQLVDFHLDVPVVGTNDAWAGQYIGIQFQSVTAPNLIGGVWDLDNVRLAETLNVPNFSFESVMTQLADPRVDSWQKAPQPALFDTNVFGAWENLAGVFLNPASTNADYIDNAVGNQLAYLFAYPQMSIFQDFNSIDWSNSVPTHAFTATFKPGKAYSLTVGLTSSREEPLTSGSTLQLSLYYRDASSNLITIAASTVTYSTNIFTNTNHLVDFSVVVPEVKAGDPWANQYIGILFLATTPPNLIGGVWDLDNVRLDELVAPVFSNPQWSNGQFNVTLQSEPGRVFEILAGLHVAAAATNWVSLATITNVTGSVSYSDPSTNLTQRFYKARQLP